MILPVLLAQPSPPQENVDLDDERLKDDIPKGLHKVELDLDDALFLEFEEKETPPPEAPSAPSAPPAPPALQADLETPLPQSLWKKPLPWVAVLGLLIMVSGAAWVLKPWKKFQNNAPVPSSATVAPLPDQAPPSAAPESSSAVHYRRTFTFEPFMLEHTQNNQTSFLTHQIYIPGIPVALAQEIEDKTTALRYEIYAYLQKIDRSQLTGSRGNKELENALLAVVNTSLKDGQATEVLLETRVVN